MKLKVLELEKFTKLTKCSDFIFFSAATAPLLNKLKTRPQFISFIYAEMILQPPLRPLSAPLPVEEYEGSARSSCETRNLVQLPHFSEGQLRPLELDDLCRTMTLSG